MGLAHVPFEGGQTAKHQNKVFAVLYRAISWLLDLLKVHNKQLNFIFVSTKKVFYFVSDGEEWKNPTMPMTYLQALILQDQRPIRRHLQPPEMIS